MVLVNYTTRELTAKLVFYGPGLCGKTTNLQFIFDNLLPKDRRGKMVSLSTETDRTLFFDFLPLELGTIRGLKTRLQLYTVPGQVHYNATRKIVLKGADGIVFVADSQATARASNIESYKNMKANLAEHGIDLRTIPHVFQFNKRDLQGIMPVDEMVEDLNEYNVPFWEAVAVQGIGVEDTLKGITRLVMKSMAQRFAGEAVKEVEATPAAAVAEVAAPAPPAVVAPVVATPAAVEEPLEILDVGEAMLVEDEAPAEAEAPQPFGSLLDAPSAPATPFELEAAEFFEEPEVVHEIEAEPEPEADAGGGFQAGDTIHSAEGLEGLLRESDLARPHERVPTPATDLELEPADLDEQTMIAPEPVAAAGFPEEIMLSGDTLLSSEGFEGLPSESDLVLPSAPPDRAWSPEAPIGTPDLLAEELTLSEPPTPFDVGGEAPPHAAPAEPELAALHEPEAADVSVPVDLGSLERGEVVERTVEVPLEIADGRGGTRRVVLAIRLRLDVR